jgi:hypothetical protein
MLSIGRSPTSKAILSHVEHFDRKGAAIRTRRPQGHYSKQLTNELKAFFGKQFDDHSRGATGEDLPKRVCRMPMPCHVAQSQRNQEWPASVISVFYMLEIVEIRRGLIGNLAFRVQ